MKLKLAILVLFAFLAMNACKKEDKKTSTPINNSVSGGPVNSLPPVSSATVFSGIFVAVSDTYCPSSFSVPIIGSSVYAYFTSTPQPGMDSFTSIKVNSIYLNGDSLPYNYTFDRYVANQTYNLATETWSVNGANSISSFTFVNTLAPKANNLATLPGTISLSTGFTVNISGVTNVTDAYLFMTDGSSSITRTITLGNNVIAVTPNDLASFSTTTVGIIQVSMENKKAYIFSGKDYQFIRDDVFGKDLTILP